MDLDALRQRAHLKRSQLASAPPDGPDAFARDVLAFFARIPEPPLYRRRDDPLRQHAQALLDEGEWLLARGMNLVPEALAFVRAVEEHLLSLWLIVEGRVEAAEPIWHQALDSERKARAPLRLWTRSDELRPAVFEKESGRSRFDPWPEASVEVRLVCPSCQKVSLFGLSARLASHQLRCSHCSAHFVAYLAEVRSLEIQALGRRRKRYQFRVEELSGLTTRIEFDDATPEELHVARRDLLAFLYLPADSLRGVLNLNSSRVLWVTSPSACFVATVAFGPDAPELIVFRAFRDQVLMHLVLGRAFVDWYYRHGPQLARMVERRAAVKRVARFALRGVLRMLEKIV